MTPEDILNALDMLKAGRSIDEQTGAPQNVRAAVGGAQTERDRLATIRRFYPDAQPFGDDNFVFTDPRTGRRALYNPPGFDLGDPISVVPEVAELLGGTVGTVLATPAITASGPAAPYTAAKAFGLGAAGGRELAGILQSNIGSTVDTRTLPERATDAATTAALNMMAERVGQIAGAGLESARPRVREFVRRRAQDAVQRFDDLIDLGIRPRGSTVTGSPSLGTVEQTLASTPGGATVMRDIGEAEREGLEAELRSITSDLGAEKDTTLAGRAVQRGVKRFGEQVEGRVGLLYEAAFDVVPEDLVIQGGQVAPLVQRATALAEEAARSPKLADENASSLQTYKQILDGIANGTTTFIDLRQIRTNLGKKLKPATYNEGGSQFSRDKALYGALSEIMENIAEGYSRSDGVTGKALLARANNFRRVMGSQLDALQKAYDTEAPERVIEALRLSGSGGKGGASRIKGLRRALSTTAEGRAVFDATVGAVLNRLGRANPGQQGASGALEGANDFSVSTFLKNWSALDRAAKRALFGGTRYSSLRPRLDRLVRLSSAVKNADRLANTSNTGRVIVGFLGLTGGAGVTAFTNLNPVDMAVTGLQTFGALYAGSKITAKLITNPGFVNWLARAPRNFTEASVSRWAARLANVAEAEPEIRDEIQSLQFALEQGQ